MIKLHPNPRFAEFRQMIGGDPAFLCPWSGTLFRIQSVDYPSPAVVLGGAGAKQRGGRWNPPGIAAVYGSTTDSNALEESKANDRYYGIITRCPRLLVAVAAQTDRMLDLTSPWTRRRLGLTLAELLREDWRKLQESGQESVTQALGRAAFECGASGILARSSANAKGVNVAVFPPNLGQGEGVTVWEDEKLRRLAAKISP